MPKKTKDPIVEEVKNEIPEVEETVEEPVEKVVEEPIDQAKIFEANWKRSLADYQNLLKRVESEKREFVKFASSNIISKLLPTLDILELAAKHSGDQGVQMAVKQFQSVLKEEGLQEINPQPGEVYDHSLHECIEIVDGGQSNTIVETVTKGYKMDDFVIRPAKVKVFKS
jgi:molecular chaperone GrpE